MRKSQVLKLYSELGENLKSFQKEIIKRGFSKIDQGAYKLVYSKNKLSYVVKIANSCNDEFASIPQKIKKYYIEPYYCDNQIVIQQRANTKNQEVDYNKILDQLGYKVCQRLDIIPQNCGSIKDKPVVFDFAEIR